MIQRLSDKLKAYFNYKRLFFRYSLYIFVVGISFIPLVSIFSTDKLLHTHDGLVHIPRMAAYYKALSDGQIPVRWAADLNYGYGMPLFIFIYQLPYFLSSILLTLGFSLVASFKIILSLSFIFSGIFILAFGKEFFKDDRKALLVAIFYQFAPFRLVELLIRGSFGEIYTYTFLPLVLFGLILIFKKNRFRYYLLTSIATALLILSHNSISLVFFAACLLFVFIFGKTRENVIFGSRALIAGLLLSIFYWLPAVFEHKYTYGDLFMKDIYLNHFPPFKRLFIPNFTNLTSLRTEGISVQIGLFHTIAILVSLGLLLSKRKINILSKKLLVYSGLLLVIALFFTQPVSVFFWENISLLRQFQFPWRFLAVISFACSLLAFSYLDLAIFKKRLYYWILIIVVVFSTLYYWQPALGYDTINEDYYWNFPLNTTYYGETDVVWSAGSAKAYPKNPVEVIEGSAVVGSYRRKSNQHIYTVYAKTESVLVDHTQYFPGWRVYTDNIKTPIEFQNQNWRGQITFPVSKGEHNIKVIFKESKIRLFSDLVSLFSIFVLIIMWFANEKLKNI